MLLRNLNSRQVTAIALTSASSYFLGEGPIFDESVSILGASLTDNSSLALELIPTIEENQVILIKYSLVYDNDTQPKYNPSMPGQKTQEYSLEISSIVTVREMKSQLLSHYLSQMCQSDAEMESHCQYHSLPFEKRVENIRIRLTNWAGECCGLMDEVNEESKDLEEYSVGEINFNPTYLLHLEEGRFPIKGMLSIKVRKLPPAPLTYLSLPLFSTAFSLEERCTNPRAR
jgi:hypothetical protein